MSAYYTALKESDKNFVIEECLREHDRADALEKELAALQEKHTVDGPNDMVEIGFPGGDLARDLTQKKLVDDWKALAIKRGDELASLKEENERLKSHFSEDEVLRKCDSLALRNRSLAKNNTELRLLFEGLSDAEMFDAIKAERDKAQARLRAVGMWPDKWDYLLTEEALQELTDAILDEKGSD